jgi:hypothetical protein
LDKKNKKTDHKIEKVDADTDKLRACLDAVDFQPTWQYASRDDVQRAISRLETKGDQLLKVLILDELEFLRLLKHSGKGTSVFVLPR